MRKRIIGGNILVKTTLETSLCFNKLEHNDLTLTHFFSFSLHLTYSSHMDGGAKIRLRVHELQ